jgi:hypothetical protein
MPGTVAEIQMNNKFVAFNDMLKNKKMLDDVLKG